VQQVISKATKQRHEVIIERSLDEIGIIGDFLVEGDTTYGPEIREAAKKRYQCLLYDARIVGHNGRETLLLCALQSMVQNFVIGYRTCLIAHKPPPQG